MSVNVQARGTKFQVRVKHALLPRPFFFTFDTHDEARNRGESLQALLDRGIVPQEFIAKPATASEDVLLVKTMRDFIARAPAVTPSDEELLDVMMSDAPIVGTRLSQITYGWAVAYVDALKIKRNLSPGSIRKRIGALARVLDWQINTSGSKLANPLRTLPVGYSQYTARDRAALPKDAEARVDVKRDRRLLPGEEERIREHLGDMELLFDLIINTGLRLREAYRLRVDQLDFKKGIIHVEGTKGTRGMLKPRTVPMLPALRATLAKHCKGRVGLVFPYWSGDADPVELKRVTARLSYLFSNAFKKAGAKDITEHDLRHEACCRWFEHRTGSGWTLSEIEVCKIMGWSSTAMVMRYASLRGEDLAARFA